MRTLAASAARVASSSEVRWIAFYSNLDVFVQPARSAMLPRSMGGTSVFVKDHGHVGIMVSPIVTRQVVDQLEQLEQLETAAVSPSEADADAA
jgi:hypothetical protein